MNDPNGPPTRVRYFGGEYLLTKDFQTDQDYHRSGRERFNSGVFRCGVIDGLDVTFDSKVSSTTVIVASGRAMDGNGRLLILSDEQHVDLSAEMVSPKCYLIIRYGEAQKNPAEPQDPVGKRVVEQPSVVAVSRAPDDGEVLLAVVDIAGGNIIGIDAAWGQLGTRRHIGAVLGSIEFPVDSVFSPGSRLLPPIDPSVISIAARKYEKEEPPTLEISAPRIALYGDVWAPNGIRQSMNFSGQTLAFDTSQGSPEQWNVSGPFSADAVVTAAIVPLGADGKSPDFSNELIAIDEGFQYGFFVLCSGANLVAGNAGGWQSLAGAKVTSFARTDIRVVKIPEGTSMTAGTLTITVRKGENVFYYVSVFPHLPTGVGVYVGTSIFGANDPPLIAEG